MAVETRTAEALRARVVRGLHGPIRDMVSADDALEAVIRAEEAAHGTDILSPAIWRAVRRCLRARDAYVNEIVARVESGEEVE